MGQGVARSPSGTLPEGGDTEKPNLPTMTKQNALNWFEIAVADFARAKKFYETILAEPLQEFTSPTCQMAVFDSDMKNGIGGGLSKTAEGAPGAGGTLVYLNVEGKLDAVIARISDAGGTVVKPRFAIGEHGFIAIFRDTEGNVVGLHSMS